MAQRKSFLICFVVMEGFPVSLGVKGSVLFLLMFVFILFSTLLTLISLGLLKVGFGAVAFRGFGWLHHAPLGAELDMVL